MAENRKSAVWGYFELNNDRTRTICQLCKTSLNYSGSTTSSMRSHLAFRHPSVTLSNPVKHGPKQATLSFVQKPTLLTTAKTEILTRKLALMCAIDLKPISMVDGVGFQYFLKELNPEYKTPCRKTVSKYLQKMYEEEKADLISVMTGMDVAFTSDLWTSVSVQGYITVTGHFISKDWNLVSKVLATRVTELRHTGSNIALEVSKIKDEFDINVCPAFVTDNAGNMLVAAKELNIPHVSCFAHTLQLGIEDGLKINQIARVLGASRKLVAHFSHSVLSTNALLAKQTEGQKLKLIQDVPTRWNSSYLMLERLLKLRIPVYAVIFDDSVTKANDRIRLDIKDNFWKVMEEIVPILEPLADITEILGKEDCPTGSSVYILLNNIFKNVLNLDPDDSVVVRELKQKIREGLQKRFKLNDQGEPIDEILSSPLFLAAMLDPRYKSLLGREVLSASKIEILNLILTDLMDALGENVTDTVTVKQEPEVSDPPAKKSKILKILQGDAVDCNSQISQKTSQVELSDFLKEPVTMSDPLKWWKINEGKFPRLEKLARKYLAIPATSIPSERIFSVAGQTVTKLRASLDSETVDQIVFLNKNMKESIKAQLRSNSMPNATLPSTTVIAPQVPQVPINVVNPDTQVKREQTQS